MIRVTWLKVLFSFDCVHCSDWTYFSSYSPILLCKLYGTLIVVVIIYYLQICCQRTSQVLIDCSECYKNILQLLLGGDVKLLT